MPFLFGLLIVIGIVWLMIVSPKFRIVFGAGAMLAWMALGDPFGWKQAQWEAVQRQHVPYEQDCNINPNCIVSPHPDGYVPPEPPAKFVNIVACTDPKMGKWCCPVNYAWDKQNNRCRLGSSFKADPDPAHQELCDEKCLAAKYPWSTPAKR